MSDKPHQPFISAGDGVSEQSLQPGRTNVQMSGSGIALRWTPVGGTQPATTITFDRSQVNELRNYLNENFKGDCPCTWNQGLKWSRNDGRFVCTER